MKKRYQKYLYFFLVFLFLFTIMPNHGSAGTTDSDNKNIPAKENVPLDKEWIITFNNELEPSSITSDNVYVFDQNSNVVPTSVYVSDNNKQVLVKPPIDGYHKQTTYTLYIGSNVYSKKLKLIKKPVTMNFTTGTAKSEQSKEFIPRNDSANKIELSNKVVQVDNGILENSSIDLNHNVLVYKGKNDKLLSLKADDIVILPATDEYPGGYAKKIVKTEFDGTNTKVYTSEPKMEDVIQNIDLSKKFDINLMETGLVQNTYPAKIKRMSTSQNKIVYAVSNQPEKKITLGKESNYQYIEYKNFPVLMDDDNNVIATINGKLKMFDPQVDLDISSWRGKFNYAEFSTRYENNIKVTFDSPNAFKKKFDPTLATIPLKFMGTLGGDLVVKAVFSAEGKISSEVSLDSELSVRIGAKNDNGTIKGFNESQFENKPVKVGFIKGNAESKGAVRTELALALFQYHPASLFAEGGLKATLEGEASTTSLLCFKGDLSAYADLGLEIQLPFYKQEFKYPPWKKTLLKGSSCQVNDLIIDPGKIVLKPGESIRLGVKGIDASYREKQFNLPDTGFKLKSTNDDVVKVNIFGDVSASVNAKEGDEAEIEVTYDNQFENKITKTIKVQIAKDNQAKTLVDGQTEDIVTRDPISGATVTVLDYFNKVITETTSNENGLYNVKLPAGKYKLKTTASHYKVVTTNIEVSSDSTNNTLHVKPILLAGENTEVGTVKGEIVDAVDGSAVEGAILSFREGNNQNSGDVITSTVTNSNGVYEAILPAGTYTAEIVKEGYNRSFVSILSVANKETDKQNATITPSLTNGDMRIVLSWGEYPEDLDGHLYGPADNGAFHLYFKLVGNQDYELYSGAMQDIDARNSYGPETVTITEPYKGIYRYAIHDFTNRDNSDSYDLSFSRAKVEIYMGDSDQPVKVFEVPENEQGTYWKVFDYNSITGKIIPINQITYETPEFEYGID